MAVRCAASIGSRKAAWRLYQWAAMRFDSRIFVFCALLALPAVAADAPAGPHYVSVRRDQANLREGPSYAHRILWIYQHKDYPLKVIASYDAWRRVKDVDGTVGWMHHTQLSDRRTVLFIGFTKSALRTSDDPASKIVAYAQPGVVAKLKACKPAVCEVEASGTDGWVDKRNIWGVDVGEVFQ
jgi:SH3-like domain-containing protein